MKKITLLFAFIFPTILMAQLNTDLGHLYPGEEVLIKTQDDWGKENYKKVINEFKNDPLKLGEIVFLGNSITAGGGNWSLRLDHPNIKNRGIGGDTTDGVLARLDEVIYFQPEAVFLLIPRESNEEKKEKIEADIMDYDGAGNFGRIPSREKKKF